MAGISAAFWALLVGLAAAIKLTPLVFIVLAVGYFGWYATTTFTETEQASLGWSTLQSTIIDHIELTLVAAIVVIVIAIPLGILLTRPSMRWLSPIAVNIANIGQAAPAVGLLVLFTFWLGTGFRTAVIGLVVYAVLQILYSLFFKHEPVIDLAMVASGFLLRAIAGGLVAPGRDGLFGPDDSQTWHAPSAQEVTDAGKDRCEADRAPADPGRQARRTRPVLRLQAVRPGRRSGQRQEGQGVPQRSRPAAARRAGGVA